jgi:hypothetical protein
MLKILGLPVSKWPLLLLAGDVVMFGLSVPIGFCPEPQDPRIALVFLDLFTFPLILMFGWGR